MEKINWKADEAAQKQGIPKELTDGEITTSNGIKIVRFREQIEKNGKIEEKKMKYTTLSGSEFEVTDEFKMFGMNALWSAFESCKNPEQAKLLDEAHSIMSAVLYGTITQEQS